MQVWVYWTKLVRVARLAPWNPNPLMRPLDRLLSSIQILAAAVCLLAVPVAGAVGTATYSSAVVRIRQHAASEVSASATIATDPVRVPETTVTQAVLRWEWHGQVREATVAVPQTAMRGDREAIQLDSNGRITPGSADQGNAVVSAITAAISVLGLAWFCSVLALQLTRRLIRHRHGADCDREWHRLDCANG